MAESCIGNMVMGGHHLGDDIGRDGVLRLELEHFVESQCQVRDRVCTGLPEALPCQPKGSALRNEVSRGSECDHCSLAHVGLSTPPSDRRKVGRIDCFSCRSVPWILAAVHSFSAHGAARTGATRRIAHPADRMNRDTQAAWKYHDGAPADVKISRARVLSQSEDHSLQF